MWRICYQKAPQLYISRPRLLMGNFKGFKARPVDGHLQGPLSENSYNCYSGKIWAARLYIKTVHCSSCNDFHITIPDFEAAYQQAQARNIQVKGPFDNKSFIPTRKHYGRNHSKKVACFCVSEEHSSCLLRDLFRISLFISKIHKHGRDFGHQ